MRNINVINTNPAIIKDLYEGDALTFEGMTTDTVSLEDMFDWIEDYTKMKKYDVYITKGKDLNTVYNFPRNKRYPADLSIVSIKLTDMEDFSKIIMPRFQVYGRWMSDVVDNRKRVR